MIIGISLKQEICCMKNVWMMIGMWTDLGEDSQSSLCWEEIARGIFLVGRESKKKIITTRPENVLPGVWMKIGKVGQYPCLAQSFLDDNIESVSSRICTIMKNRKS